MLLLLTAISTLSALQQPAPLSRRAVLGGVAGAACSAVTCVRPASASLKADLLDAEAALAAAEQNEDVNDALTRLLDVVNDYGGVPTQAQTTELVDAMRSRRTALSGSKAWNGISEEAYNRLMRSVDPWRVTELEPALARSIYTFPFAYLALLGVQKFLPKFFAGAYAGAAALVLGPLLFQIIVG